MARHDDREWVAPKRLPHGAVDDALHLRRWCRLSRNRKALQHACSRFPLARLRELDAGDAALTPCDAAPADRRVKECKAACHHDAILTSRQPHDLENLAVEGQRHIACRGSKNACVVTAILLSSFPRRRAGFVDNRCSYRCFSMSQISA